MKIWELILMVTLLLVNISQAAKFTLEGSGQTGNTITVAPGATFTVAAKMEAPENGNTFEVFLGFDVSDATRYGLVGSPVNQKLALVSSTTDVANSINSDFAVYRSAKLGSGREAANAVLGGRAYGLKVVGARSANIAGGTSTLFSVTFQNKMSAGENTAIVISDAGSGASYTSAWKSGTTSYRGSYVLNVRCSAFPGDANGDGKVDVGDLGILAANYGGAEKTWGQGDFNGDKKVDVGDLGILAANYGHGSTSSNFSADYAKVFGTSMDEIAKEDDSATSVSSCGLLGMPLIAGLFMTLLELGTYGCRICKRKS